MRKPVRIGVGGPVGSGKTALIEKLCKRLRDEYEIAVITNDIFTKEDALILTRAEALPEERIIGVETGGCPHTAVREDISMNLDAIDILLDRFDDLDMIFVESGGDNLAATFSPELVDGLIFVIDVGEGEKIPRKGGPGDNEIRSSGDKQDRHSAICAQRSWRDGKRYENAARRQAFRFYEPVRRHRPRRGDTLDKGRCPVRGSASAGMTGG